MSKLVTVVTVGSKHKPDIAVAGQKRRKQVQGKTRVNVAQEELRFVALIRLNRTS